MASQDHQHLELSWGCSTGWQTAYEQASGYRRPWSPHDAKEMSTHLCAASATALTYSTGGLTSTAVSLHWKHSQLSHDASDRIKIEVFAFLSSRCMWHASDINDEYLRGTGAQVSLAARGHNRRKTRRHFVISQTTEMWLGMCNDSCGQRQKSKHSQGRDTTALMQRQGWGIWTLSSESFNAKYQP